MHAVLVLCVTPSARDLAVVIINEYSLVRETNTRLDLLCALRRALFGPPEVPWPRGTSFSYCHWRPALTQGYF